MKKIDVPTILVIDDMESELAKFREVLNQYHLYTAQSGPAAQKILKEQSIDLIVLDQRFEIPEEELVAVDSTLSKREKEAKQGLLILQWLRHQGVETPAVVCTTQYSDKMAQEALEARALHYSSKNDFYGSRGEAERVVYLALQKKRKRDFALYSLAREMNIELRSPMDQILTTQQGEWRRRWLEFCRDFFTHCLQSGLLPVEAAWDIHRAWVDFKESRQTREFYDELGANEWAYLVQKKLAQTGVDTSLYPRQVDRSQRLWFFTDDEDQTYLLVNPYLLGEFDQDQWRKIEFSIQKNSKTPFINVHSYDPILLDEGDPYLPRNYLLLFHTEARLHPEINFSLDLPDGYYSPLDFSRISYSLSTKDLIQIYESLRDLAETVETSSGDSLFPWTASNLWFTESKEGEYHPQLLPLSLGTLIQLSEEEKTGERDMYSLFYQSFHGRRPTEEEIESFRQGEFQVPKRFTTFFFGRSNSQEWELFETVQKLKADPDWAHEDCYLFVNPVMRWEEGKKGWREKEIDLIVVSIRRVFALEAKATNDPNVVISGTEQCHKINKMRFEGDRLKLFWSSKHASGIRLYPHLILPAEVYKHFSNQSFVATTNTFIEKFTRLKNTKQTALTSDEVEKVKEIILEMNRHQTALPEVIGGLVVQNRRTTEVSQVEEYTVKDSLTEETKEACILDIYQLSSLVELDEHHKRIKLLKKMLRSIKKLTSYMREGDLFWNPSQIKYLNQIQGEADHLSDIRKIMFIFPRGEYTSVPWEELNLGEKLDVTSQMGEILRRLGKEKQLFEISKDKILSMLVVKKAQRRWRTTIHPLYYLLFAWENGSFRPMSKGGNKFIRQTLIDLLEDPDQGELSQIGLGKEEFQSLLSLPERSFNLRMEDLKTLARYYHLKTEIAE